MKQKKLLLIVLVIVFNSIFILSACSYQIDGLVISKNNITIDETLFDTQDLKLIKSDAKGETNYSLKITGTTTPLSDYDWQKWFGEEDSDISGKIAVCLQLIYPHEILDAHNSTLSIINTEDKTILQSYKITEIPTYLINENYIYIVLNPKYDIISIQLDYTMNNIHKDITYEIDMLNINSDSERLG